MSDLFLLVPGGTLGDLLTPYETVDWLAFGPPSQNARALYDRDTQIHGTHAAAGCLLLSLWDGGLTANVRSPSNGSWYRVPSAYWLAPPLSDIGWLLKAADVPETLPGQPRPLDPRYGIHVPYYRHQLPVDDLVGQLIFFRQADVRIYCSTAGPTVQSCAPLRTLADQADNTPPLVNKIASPIPGLANIRHSTRPSEKLYAPPARRAAEIITESKVSRAEAIRQALSETPIDRVNVTDASIERGVRSVFDRMYYPDGTKIQN